MPEVNKKDIWILIGVLSGRLSPDWLDKLSFIDELREDLEELEEDISEGVDGG